MTTYFSTKRLFAYTITNTTPYVLDSTDFSILESVFNRWDELITPDSRFEGFEYTIEVAIRIETLALGILGGASIANVYYFGNLPLRFGHMFPATGNITLNYLYISGLKNSLREGGKSEYYYVMLHEVGHILGIGPFWAYSGAPIVSYLDNGITKYYYTGVNALREYRSYFSPMASMLVGIPIEDDGGSGTAFVHPEEGTESYLSSDTRMINGVWHPGLDTELMTGWLDAGPAATPLSRITLGFLEDMGYGVNYNLADYYRVMSEWLDLSYASNCFKQTYVQGFLDISGGSITTRGTEHGLVIGGDSSLNGTVYLGDSIYVRSDGLVAPGDASNGATPFYVDASYVDVSGGAFIGDVVSYDISGDATNDAIPKPDIQGGPSVAGSVVSSSVATNANWSQFGFDIDSELQGDESGHSVSIINSATYGRVVAIGARYNNSTTTSTSDRRGHVRVYQYRQYTLADANKYHHTSQFQNITQTKPLIITASNSTAPDINTYYWMQLGLDIDGEAAGDNSGHSVSLVDSSANGLVVAIGAPYNDAGNAINDDRGHVRVYKYDVNKTTSITDQASANFGPVGWRRLGADIDGEAAGDVSGWPVSLVDASGSLVVAIGGHGNDGNGNISGHVRVYQYSATKTSAQTDQNLPNFGPAGWNRLGADIDGEAANDTSGWSVSLVNSPTGLVVAIGANRNDAGNGTNDNRGHVRVYQYDANKTTAETSQTNANFGPIGWRRLGADIDGEATEDYSGSSVSLVYSATNGLVVAINAPLNDGTPNTLSNRGHVRVYQYDASKNISDTSQTSSNFGPIGWRRLGADIDGEGADDNSISSMQAPSVSLVDSAIGLALAIGAPFNDGILGSRTFKVRSNGSNYTIDGFVGNFPLLLLERNTVYYFDVSDVSSSHPFALRLSTSDTATPVPGTVNNDPATGRHQGSPDPIIIYTVPNNPPVSIIYRSINNSTTIGTINYPNSNYGHVRVYKYDANKTTAQLTDQTLANFGPIGWNRIGFDIDGEAAGDRSGWSTSLVDTADGLVVAAGALKNIGRPPAIITLTVTSGLQTMTIRSSDGQPYGGTSGVGRFATVFLVLGTTYRFDVSAVEPDRPFAIRLSRTNKNDPVPGTVNNDPGSGRHKNSANKIVEFTPQTGSTIFWVSTALNNADQYGHLSVDSNQRGHVRVYEIPYTKTYSDVSAGFFDVSGGFLDVQVIGGYLNDGLTTSALYVNGDTDLSGGLTVSGDVSFNAGNLFVAGDLSLNGNLLINSFAPNSIGADAIDSTVNINFANKLAVSTADLSFSATGIQVATNFNSNNTPIALAANLTVPANIAIVDGSNGTVYGSYLTLTNKAATAYYNVGKSASGLFNIVNQSNAGVYLTAGGTSFTGTSDARLKTNIAPLESATDKIMALNPCTYQWKSDIENKTNEKASTNTNTKTHIGFIAQEVEQVMPELVHPIDHPAGSDYKGVNTTDLIPYLVRTIQEQTATMNALESRIETLKQSRLARK